ncbi:uncharacterized protein LOC9649424 isoform X2 [Selaginella moellendorffii]|uniref:uncharacterized protein LOC9649424 isoform X2 n=1 Tax=Selaginella moellendorffii TaxID=88036 RepID=UPI000D1C8BB4|nr:uncharacterized protein LOC9649424 isoform X2 [Selaginella moellendorffii]|eukprot:XP_024515973.1 uncharacterized protein LOC9649424 isoform X2 [Selaginella moellendorffii]
MPPKKKGKRKKKKAPAFYTDIDDLLPFGVVRANELITTALGIQATVLGVKHKRCSEGANVWKPVAELQEKQRKEDEVRAKVDDLNRKYRAGQEAKNKKKKTKPKKPKPPADATVPSPAAAAAPAATRASISKTPAATRVSISKTPAAPAKSAAAAAPSRSRK